jgi:pimeloyl-ACP methyl ester carboxylesterase
MSLVGRHVRTSLAPAPLPAAEFRLLDRTRVAVLSGRHDVFLPPGRLERTTRRRLAPATVEIVEGAGHLLPHEQPQAILAHLHRTEAAGPV